MWGPFEPALSAPGGGEGLTLALPRVQGHPSACSQGLITGPSQPILRLGLLTPSESACLGRVWEVVPIRARS